VLDWGGTGRNLVLFAGLGNTAHVFDSLIRAEARGALSRHWDYAARVWPVLRASNGL
jgi:hypothetical protein